MTPRANDSWPVYVGNSMASVDNYGLGKLGKLQRTTLEACRLPSKNVTKRQNLIRVFCNRQQDILYNYCVYTHDVSRNASR